MLNIYDLYVTRSKSELDYFNRVLHLLNFIELNDTFVQIVHLNFKYNDVIDFIKVSNQTMTAVIYNFGKNIKTNIEIIIYNLDDLIKLYIYRPGYNVFIYSGHSDGMYLIKKKVRLLRIEDFCELVFRVNNSKKADLMIFDCCLCGNIGALYVCYPFTNYILASTSYQSYFSVMETHNLYNKQDTLIYCKNIIKEIGSLEKTDHKSYDSNFTVYQMNEALFDFIQLVLQFKGQFNYSKSFVIDSAYYKDIECCFEELGINIIPLLNKFVLFNRYPKKKCGNHKLNKKKQSSIPSKLMIILKRPIHTDLKTKADIFLQLK